MKVHVIVETRKTPAHRLIHTVGTDNLARLESYIYQLQDLGYSLRNRPRLIDGMHFAIFRPIQNRFMHKVPLVPHDTLLSDLGLAKGYDDRNVGFIVTHRDVRVKQKKTDRPSPKKLFDE